MNIPWKEVQRGEHTPDETRLIWGGIEQQPIRTLSPRPLLDLVLEVALDTNRTVYASYYRTLPMLMGRQLVTADPKLFTASQGGGYATHVCWVVDLP